MLSIRFDFLAMCTCNTSLPFPFFSLQRSITHTKDNGRNWRVVCGADEAQGAGEVSSTSPHEDEATLGEDRGVGAAEGGQHDEYGHAERQDAQHAVPESLWEREEVRM